MDKIAQKANQARSLRGGSFESKIEELLKEMRDSGQIRNFQRKPKIFNGEFNPDFIVEKNNRKIVSVDSTTTARSDRLKGKQWDAFGTKKYFLERRKKKIESVVVVQDSDTTQAEKDNFRRCKARTKLPHSALDDVVSVGGFVTLLEKN